METLENFIGGRGQAPLNGDYLETIEPATGRAYARVPRSGPEDIDAAVRAAAEAFPAWSALTREARSEHLLALAQGIAQQAETLAQAESKDTGKPVSVARAVDIPRAEANFRFFATAILHEHTEAHDTDGRALNVTLRQPRGVAGCISPWNLPLYLLTWKIAPALASGNTVVAKPSEITPYTAHLLGALCREAGLPPGVINIVHGLGAEAGQALVEHPRVPALSFTGGTRTGALIGAAAARQFKHVSLELGGKNPTVIFGDADLDKALPEILRSAFSNQGQICLCGSRILVEETLFDAFLERFVQGVRALNIGDPLEADTTQGAVTSGEHRDKVLGYIQLARKDGATVHCGGGVPHALPSRCSGGFYVEPTVLTGLAPECRVMQEEIFGPVVTVTPFRDEAQALALANGTPYGLAASVWTRSLPRAHRVARKLEAGIVWVNCWMLRDLRTPFGGVKHSGVGREGGLEALRFFTEPKNVCIQMEEEPS